jgi:hypothetical protein
MNKFEAFLVEEAGERAAGFEYCLVAYVFS